MALADTVVGSVHDHHVPKSYVDKRVAEPGAIGAMQRRGNLLISHKVHKRLMDAAILQFFLQKMTGLSWPPVLPRNMLTLSARRQIFKRPYMWWGHAWTTFDQDR